MAGRHATRRALRFILIPVVLMAVLAVVSFDGDWTYLALTGAMVLVVMGLMYLERLRAERLLPPGYRGLVAEVIERRSSSLPAPEAARSAMDRLVRLQDEMDAMEGRGLSEIDGLNSTVAVWAGGLGAVLWLVAGVTAGVVHEIRGALICVVMAAFFGGLAWFTQGERKKHERAKAILQEELSRVRGDPE